MPSRVATSSPAPCSASRSSRVPAVSSGRMRLGEQAVRRAGVELLDEPERRGAGDLVAGHQRALHRGGAAPGRQHREVQVDPAVRRECRARPAGAARRRRPPGSSRAPARASRSRNSGSRGRGRLEHLEAVLGRRARRPATARSRRPRPAGASGRVTTAATSCRLSSRARSDGSGDVGRAGEDEPHRRHAHMPRPNIGCGRLLDEGRRRGRSTRPRGSPSSRPCGSRRRAGRRTGCRRGGRSRAGCSGPAARCPRSRPARRTCRTRARRRRTPACSRRSARGSTGSPRHRSGSPRSGSARG